MRYIFLLSLFVLSCFSAQAYAKSETIALVVNDGVITHSDVSARMKMIMVSAGLPNNKETRAQLTSQVVSVLVDEYIKVQEAEKYEIKISQPEINQGFEELAKQNNFTAQQFKDVIKRSGINIETLYSQIRAQLSWQKVVQARLRSQVAVSETDVDVWFKRVETSIGKNEYLVSEIFLPVSELKEEVKSKQLATRLVRDIRAEKASFYKVAQQVSQAAGAAQGGDLGWVQEGQLPPELDAALVDLDKGAVSMPIRSLSGFHVLLLRESRVISAETMPDRQEVRNLIGMQRLNGLQRRYIMDLKSSAFIENRLEQSSGS